MWFRVGFPLEQHRYLEELEVYAKPKLATLDKNPVHFHMNGEKYPRYYNMSKLSMMGVALALF